MPKISDQVASCSRYDSRQKKRHGGEGELENDLKCQNNCKTQCDIYPCTSDYLTPLIIEASWVRTWFISRALIVFKNRYFKIKKMVMFITIEMDSVPGLRQYLLHFVVVVA